MEIGSCFGKIANIALSRNNSLTYIANDACPGHLAEMNKYLPVTISKNLRAIPGFFHEIFGQIPIRVDAVLASKVLHFLSPQNLHQTFKGLEKKVASGGKVFALTVTPFMGGYNIDDDYQKRLSSGDHFPGWFEQPYKYLNKSDVSEAVYSQNLNQAMHFYTTEFFRDFLSDYAFTIDLLKYFPLNYHSDTWSRNGRENLGMILTKSSDF